MIEDNENFYQHEEDCIDAVNKISHEEMINWRMPSTDRRKMH